MEVGSLEEAANRFGFGSDTSSTPFSEWVDQTTTVFCFHVVKKILREAIEWENVTVMDHLH